MVDPRISNITRGGTSVAPKDMSSEIPKRWGWIDGKATHVCEDIYRE